MYCVVINKLKGIYMLRHIIYGINPKESMSSIKKNYYKNYCRTDTDTFYLCKNKKEINKLLLMHKIFWEKYIRLKERKQYSVAELNKMFVPIKGKIKEYIKELYEKYVVENFVFYLDYLQVVGKDEVESIWEKIEPYDYLKEHHKTIFGWLLEEKYLNMCMEIYFMFIDECEDKSLIWRNYDSSIQIIPYEDKLLAMYFGNSEFIKFINKCKFLTDFHYQNQTDKPDDISEEEWKLRKDIWDVAIGPDYIPNKHGVNLKLSNIETGDFAYIVKMKKKYIPSMEERVNTVLEAKFYFTK